MLPAPGQHLGVKVKDFRQKLMQVLRALAVFRVYVLLLQILRVPAVFRVWTRTADTSGLAVSRSSMLLWILLVLGSISAFCTAVGTATAISVTSVGTASTPSTRGIEILLIYAVYWECEPVWSILRPFVNRFDHPIPIHLQKTWTNGPTSGSWGNLLSGEATGLLGVFREYFIASTRDISGFQYSGYWVLPSISDVCTAGIACTRGFCTAHTPRTSSIWAFRTAYIPSTCSI